MTAVTIAVDHLRSGFGDRAARCIRVDAPLGSMTTYRVGGSAAVFVEPDDADDLETVRSAAAASGLSCLVLGRGSNLLVADAGVDAIVVSTARFDRAATVVTEQRSSDVFVDVGAGVSLPVVARTTVGLGLTGFEWAVGVPGTIGGAVRMNAGGHGADMATSLDSAQVVRMSDVPGDRADACDRRRTVAELSLGFRSSGLTDDEVVVGARLRLRRSPDPDASRRTIDEIVAWRRANQPGGQNAGSVFVNPVPGEVSAGELIDGLGLRGFRIGSAEVSTKHANFIQADPGGRADDVRSVIGHVRDRVADETGYRLRSEIRLVGFALDGLGRADGHPEPVGRPGQAGA
jgi:UDP-N-acetylmuramate dehydrogenase